MAKRDYQIAIIEDAIKKVCDNRKIIIQVPTGGGKTYIFSLIANRYVNNTDKSIMILVHREELMNQAAKTIEKLTGLKPCIIDSKTKKFYMAKIYIGMVESTMSRLNLFSNVGLVIIDECHVANFNKVHSIFSSELIIGFSATPLSSSKKEPMNKYYNSIIAGPQIQALIKDEFLSQNITRCPKDVVDSTLLEIDRLKGDFNESKMATEYIKTKNITNVVSTYQKYCGNKKTIIFNVNIEHSIEVARCFNFCGFNARHIDANSKDRKEIIKWFMETENAILCNIGIATVGFDEPTIMNVILNFSTLSLPKFLQTSGRGGRVINEEFIKDYQHKYPYTLTPKNHFNLIDMGGNCIRFGDWPDERNWVDVFNNPQKVNDGGIAPVKTCPNCEGLVHAAATVCNLKTFDGEECYHIFDRRKHEVDKALGEMVVVTKNINVDEISLKFKNKYEYYTFDKMAEIVVDSLFNKYRSPSKKQLEDCFLAYFEKCIEWYNKNIGGKDISFSEFHINKAKYNFDTSIQRRIEFNKNLGSYCSICGEETDLDCKDCDYPVCENCSEKEVCTNCLHQKNFIDAKS